MLFLKTFDYTFSLFTDKFKCKHKIYILFKIINHGKRYLLTEGKITKNISFSAIKWVENVVLGTKISTNGLIG